MLALTLLILNSIRIGYTLSMLPRTCLKPADDCALGTDDMQLQLAINAFDEEVDDVRFGSEKRINIASNDVLNVTMKWAPTMGFDTSCLRIDSRNARQMIVTGIFTFAESTTFIVDIPRFDFGYTTTILNSEQTETLASGPIIKLVAIELCFVPRMSKRSVIRLRNFSFSGCRDITRG